MLTVSALWDSTYAHPRDVRKSVQLRKEYFPLIEQIGLDIRPKKAPEVDWIVGRVDGLKGEIGPQGTEGEVILVLIEEDEVFKARVDLKPDDYQIACDAHRDSLYVMIRGELHRHGRLHELQRYESFELVATPKEDHVDLAFDDD